MTKPLSVSEARDKLAEVIGQVQSGGARVTIFRRGKPVVVSVADAAFPKKSQYIFASIQVSNFLRAAKECEMWQI